MPNLKTSLWNNLYLAATSNRFSLTYVPLREDRSIMNAFVYSGFKSIIACLFETDKSFIIMFIF